MSNIGGREERGKNLEKQLEEMREQLKTKDAELKKERDEQKRKLQMKEEELKKTKEELSKEREERMAEKRELEKHRRQTRGKIGCVDEGSKKWEVEVAKIGEEEIFSDYTSIGGVPFQLGCDSRTESGTKRLGVYLWCNDVAPTKTFSADVDFTVAVASSLLPESEASQNNYTSEFFGYGWPSFIAWADLMDPSKGYIQNGRITIEAKIKLICFYKNAFYDFSSPDPQLTDVTLVVGGKKFKVCKKHIAIYSDFFKALFFSDFSEKNKKRVELPEVDAKEFEDLLKMIHPQRTKTTVTKENVDYLLRLADFFIVDIIRWECIDYLKTSIDFPLAAKLQLTEQYRLPELQADLLGNMTTREAAKGVIDSDEFKNYSDPLKQYVLQQHYTLL